MRLVVTTPLVLAVALTMCGVVKAILLPEEYYNERLDYRRRSGPVPVRDPMGWPQSARTDTQPTIPSLERPADRVYHQRHDGYRRPTVDRDAVPLPRIPDPLPPRRWNDRFNERSRHYGDPGRTRFEDGRRYSERLDRREPGPPSKASKLPGEENTARPENWGHHSGSGHRSNRHQGHHKHGEHRGRLMEHSPHRGHRRNQTSDSSHPPSPQHPRPSHDWRMSSDALSRNPFQPYFGHHGSSRHHPPRFGYHQSHMYRFGSGSHHYIQRGRYPWTSRHFDSSSSSSSSSSEEEDGSRGNHCERAPYNVTCVSPDGYELRQYEEAVWATTIVNCSSSSWFRRLFRYISGENDAGVKIPMSKPVRKRMVRRQDGDNSTTDSVFSASFYLPRRFWENPPAPRDERVFLERSSLLAFSSNFSGWAEDDVTSRHYERLLQKLRQREQPIVEDEFALQCYDAPWVIMNRHNEILIEADADSGAPSCNQESTPDVIEEPTTLCEDQGCPALVKAQRTEAIDGDSSSRVGSNSEEESRRKHYATAPYDVTCVSPEGYELRQYEEAVWVTTMINGSSSSSWFRRLFRYISGENDAGIKIPMSTPVRKRMLRRENGDGSSDDIVISGSFYLQRRYWENPPQPSDEKVFLERSSLLVFSSNFSGRAYDHVTSEHYERLLEMLAEDGQPIVQDEFYFQGFDAPWVILNRHNEILIEADTDSGTPSCTPQVVEEPPNGIRQCGDHECPEYEETQRISDTVVIREVAAGVYVTKKSSTCNMSNAMGDTYMPLRRYFQGENIEGVSIPTTTPVLQLAVRPDRSASLCNFTYQTSFYIPELYQAEPPTPLEESVVVSETDTALYYVMTFHEKPIPKVAFQKYHDFRALITDAGHCFLPGEFRLAFYDAPFRPLPHLYEMWVPVDTQCNDVRDEEDFDEALFPVDDGGNLILPVMNDDPNPLP